MKVARTEYKIWFLLWNFLVKLLISLKICIMDTLNQGASFHYPKKGGLGGIWRAIAKKLPRNNVKFRAEVVQIDLENKTAKTRDDIEIKYKVSSR